MQQILMFINWEIIEINENEQYHNAFCKSRNLSRNFVLSNFAKVFRYFNEIQRMYIHVKMMGKCIIEIPFVARKTKQMAFN